LLPRAIDQIETIDRILNLVLLWFKDGIGLALTLLPGTISYALGTFPGSNFSYRSKNH